MNIFVTGANRGIGLEFVRQLTTRGETVLASCRHPEKANDLKSLLSEGWIIPIDVTIQDSIVQGAKVVRKKFNRIDLLINNAGVMACPLGRTAQGLDTQLGTNHLGHFVLTARLIPQLLAGSPARIVNLSIAGHRLSPFRFEDPLFDGDAYDKWTAHVPFSYTHLRAHETESELVCRLLLEKTKLV